MELELRKLTQKEPARLRHYLGYRPEGKGSK